MSPRSPGAWWNERVVPRLVDASLNDATAASWRRRVCADLSGTVLEVGFGSGRNVPYLPAAVDEVLAVEPADLAWERAGARIAAYGRPVTRIGLDGASLPIADASVDAVLSTWTLCTVGDLASALGEARRVLRPGGALHFVEHVRSDRLGVARWQSRLQPAWGVVAGGCHLDRDILASMRAAGFTVAAEPAQAPMAMELVPFVSGRAT